MGVKLSELLSDRRTIEVPFGGRTITVTYRLSERTPKATDELNPAAHVVAEMIRLVVSWDIEDDKGKPVPITEKALQNVPTPVMRAIWNWIWADAGLGEAGSSSNGSSAQTDE